jgi:hypothetical protein
MNHDLRRGSAPQPLRLVHSSTDQQQREQIEAIKAQLTALEDGTPNVIDV